MYSAICVFPYPGYWDCWPPASRGNPSCEATRTWNPPISMLPDAYAAYLADDETIERNQ